MCLPTIKHLDPLPSQRRQRRSNAIWLLVGPLIGGVVTHVWDLSILRHHDVANHYSSDIIYAAEFAPRLDDRSRRRKRSASLDDWTRDETENLGNVDHSDLPPMHERLRSRARQGEFEPWLLLLMLNRLLLPNASMANHPPSNVQLPPRARLSYQLSNR
jgi:hypothetical protein